MNFLKDYDCTILYHLGCANVVADTLSRTVPTMAGMMAHEWQLLKAFSLMTMSVAFASLAVRLDLETEI